MEYVFGLRNVFDISKLEIVPIIIERARVLSMFLCPSGLLAHAHNGESKFQSIRFREFRFFIPPVESLDFSGRI